METMKLTLKTRICYIQVAFYVGLTEHKKELKRSKEKIYWHALYYVAVIAFESNIVYLAKFLFCHDAGYLQYISMFYYRWFFIASDYLVFVKKWLNSGFNKTICCCYYHNHLVVWVFWGEDRSWCLMSLSTISCTWCSSMANSLKLYYYLKITFVFLLKIVFDKRK